MPDDMTPTEIAIENVLKLSKCVDELLGEEAKPDALVTRASGFPSFMLSSGLVPTLTFWMSKVVKKKRGREIDLREVFADVLKYLLSPEAGCGGLANGLRADLSGEGYATSLALYVAGLIRMGHLDLGDAVSGPPRKLVAVLAEKLLELMRGPKSVQAESDMLEYASEVKKMLSALYK